MTDFADLHLRIAFRAFIKCACRILVGDPRLHEASSVRYSRLVGMETLHAVT